MVHAVADCNLQVWCCANVSMFTSTAWVGSLSNFCAASVVLLLGTRGVWDDHSLPLRVRAGLCGVLLVLSIFCFWARVACGTTIPCLCVCVRGCAGCYLSCPSFASGHAWRVGRPFLASACA